MTVEVVNDQNRVVVLDDGNIVVTQGGNTVEISDVGAQGPAGVGADGYVLQAYDSTDQVAASTTVAYPIRLGIVDISDGITVANNGSGQPTRITFANDGNYDVQFSIQFVNTSASEANVNVWFRKNENDLADSNSQVTVPKKHGAADGAIIMALNLIVAAGSGDYVEIIWQTESTDVSIQHLPAGTTPTTPATPSVIVTATVVRYLETGPAGPGVPVGGSSGQVLTKTSATDYATGWTTPAMVLIKSQAITVGVASVIVTNVFSANHRNYLVVIDRAARNSPNNGQLLLTLGGIVTGYYFGGRSQSFSSATVVHSGSNVGSWLIGYTEQAPWGGQQLTSVTISAPYLTTRKTFTALSFGGEYHSTLGGTMLNETPLTYFTLTLNAGTFTEGQITVYGYNS